MVNYSNCHFIRSPIHLENQKFGRRPGRSIKISPELSKNGLVEVIGLDFLSSHYHALAAIQRLLTATNYKGNTKGVVLSRESNSFQFEGWIPRIKFTKTEFLEAYGVKRYKTSRNKYEFSGKEAETALEALYHLGHQPFLIVATRTRWNNGSQIVDRYQTLSPIIRIYEGWEGLTDEENDDIYLTPFNSPSTRKHKGFVVEPCPILVDQIDSYFVVKPANVYQEIKMRFPNASKYAYTFIDWIITSAAKKKRKITRDNSWPENMFLNVSVKSLAYILRMNRYIITRNWKKIELAVDRCIEIAIQLGWLSRRKQIEFMDSSKLSRKEILYLNKERFEEITKQSKEQMEQIEQTAHN